MKLSRFKKCVSEICKQAFTLPLSVLLMASTLCFPVSATPVNGYQEQEYQTSYGRTMRYRIYIPEGYDAERAYPLILFLHGAGERGSDNTAQLKNVAGELPQKYPETGNCIIVAPQCPENEKWVNVNSWSDCRYSTDSIPESQALSEVVELLGALQKQYHVDQDRLYVTGLSMGGYGTWDLLVRHGDLFAAAIPVCGGCDVSRAELLTQIPIHTFHGIQDPTVPCLGTETMVQNIRALGGEKIQYTAYPEGNHLIWDQAYATEGLFSWLLSQRLSDRLPPESEGGTESGTEPETDGESEEITTEGMTEAKTEPQSESGEKTTQEGETNEPSFRLGKWAAPAITVGAVGIAMAVVAITTAILRKRKRR